MKPKRTALAALLLLAAVSIATAQAQGDLISKFRDLLSLEMGSVAINGTNYSKLVLSPEMRLGKLKLGLYLPVIYRDDLFDPSTWYAPGGNNEWDFGGSKWSTDWQAAALDAAHDTLLKIKYVEYGEQLQDTMFFKVGNLKGLTIGHGLVMRDYRNDTEFPAVRRIGANIGYDFGIVGFEALANDLPVPDIAGGRFYFRPIPGAKLAVGISGVVDMRPGAELPAGTWAAATSSVKFASGGVDLDMPIIPATPAFGMRAFADAAATVPWVSTAFSSPLNPSVTVTPGLRTDLIYDGTLRNWGAAAGFLGNMLFLDWRVEYRYFNGIFKPAFYDATYDRMRANLTKTYVSYLDGTNTFAAAPTVMGVYGEAAAKLFGEKLTLLAGYMWPWSPTAGVNPLDCADEFHARLLIKRGTIPVVDLAGSVGYDKRNLASSIAASTFRLFDADSVFSGEVLLPVPGSPNLVLAAVFQTVPDRDGSGNVIYDSVTGNPVIKPSITIETRLRF